MFGQLLSRLTADQPAPLGAEDVQLSLAALLVRVAKSDGSYDAAEIALIDGVLCDRFDLTPTAAGELRAQAEVMETEAPDTVRFTRAIKEAVPYEDRFGIVKTLWSVALADGSRDHEEDALLRLLANLLGVNDRDSAIARREAAG